MDASLNNETLTTNNNLLYKQIFDNIHSAIMVLSKDGTIINCNHQFANQALTTKDIIIGKKIFELPIEYFGENAEKLYISEMFENKVVKDKGKFYEAVYGARLKGLTDIKWYLVSSEPLINDAGECDSVFMTFVNITATKNIESALKHIVEGTSNVQNDVFFVSMMAELASVLKVKYCGIAELINQAPFQTKLVAFWPREVFPDTFGNCPDGSPCESVYNTDIRVYPDNVQRLFPEVQELKMMNIKGYCGVQLKDSTHSPIGHIFIMNDENIEILPWKETILKIFAMRAGAEIERRQSVEILRKNRELLDRIINNSSAAIFAKDLEGRYILINEHFAKTFNTTPQEIIGKTIYDIFPESEAKEIHAYDSAVLYNNSPMQFEQDVTLNKVKTTILAIRFPLYDSNGNPNAVCGISTDISEVKKKDLLIRENEKKMRRLMSYSTDFICELNRRGEFIYSNHSYSELLGISIDEIIGQAAFEFVHPDEKESVILQFRDAFQNKDEIRTAFRHINKNKEWVWLESVANFYVNESNEVNCVVISRNITKNKEIEHQLLEAKESSERANRAKSEFLANMSHEIRTPMNSILGFTEILKDKLSNNPELSNYLDGIYSGGKALLNLINDILDLSKIEAGKFEIQKTSLNIRNLIEDVKQLFSEKAKSKSLDIITSIDKNLPDQLLLDETRLRQVLFHVISNAIKFTHKGFITIIVNSFAKYEHADKIELSLEIRDTGIGISQNLISKVFEPFRQLESADNKKYEGSGLGLSISQRLVEAMGGHISIDSVVGVGSAVNIILHDVLMGKAAEQDESNALDVNSVEFSDSQVLIISNNPTYRNTFEIFLENSNLLIYEADNDVQAIESMHANNPDLIFIADVHSETHCVDFIALIRNLPEFKHIPIISILDDEFDEHSQKIKSLCDACLLKPITQRDLIKLLMLYLPHTTHVEVDAPRKVESDFIKKTKDYLVKKPDTSSTFILTLRTQVLPLYETAKLTSSIDGINKFAAQLIEISQQYNFAPLVQYGSELMNQTTTFNFEGLLSTLPEFEEILSIISKE